MRLLVQMFLFDMKMSFKSFMGGYMLIVPVLILGVLRAFLPTVENTSVTLAVVTEGPHAVDEEIIELANEVADIVRYESIEGKERKLRGVGTAEGLYWDPAKRQCVSVLERTKETNRLFSIAARFVRQKYYQENYPDAQRLTEFEHGVPPELSERTKTSPVATMGGSSFLVFMVIVTGFLIGMNVVNDKEEGTDRALRVSPVTKFDYYVGKSIFPLGIMAAYTIIALLVLGLIHVNILQVYLVVLASFSVTLLFGLFMGALAKNETEAIGVGKLASIVLLLAILGGTLLPDNWHWVVWWLPSYWMYNVLEKVFTEEAVWSAVAWKSAVIVGLTGLYFGLARKRIIAGLS